MSQTRDIGAYIVPFLLIGLGGLMIGTHFQKSSLGAWTPVDKAMGPRVESLAIVKAEDHELKAIKDMKASSSQVLQGNFKTTKLKMRGFSSTLEKNRAGLQPSSLPLEMKSSFALQQVRDLGQELFYEIQEIDNEALRENEFLTKKLNLDDSQIALIQLRRKKYVENLAKASVLQRTDSRQAETFRQKVTEQHLLWMTQTLGPENYAQFLELSQ